VLRAKEWLGLDQSTLVDPQDAREVVDAPEHRMLAETIARRGLTLLRNEGNLIPLTSDLDRVLVVTLSGGSDPAVGSAFASRLRSFLPDASVVRTHLDARSA